MTKKFLIFTTLDGLKVVAKTKEVAKLFSNEKYKQECFLEFDKENQLKWCKSFVSKNNIHKIEYKISHHV